jgi:hypothetical protein
VIPGTTGRCRKYYERVYSLTNSPVRIAGSERIGHFFKRGFGCPTHLQNLVLLIVIRGVVIRNRQESIFLYVADYRKNAIHEIHELHESSFEFRVFRGRAFLSSASCLSP